MRNNMRNIAAMMTGLTLQAYAVRSETEQADELLSVEQRRKVQTCNLSPEQIAERDRPISRQERRQMQRLAKKGRNPQ